MVALSKLPTKRNGNLHTVVPDPPDPPDPTDPPEPLARDTTVAKRYIALTLGVLLATGCSARAGANSSSPRFERSVGNATGPEAYEKALKVIRHHQFVIERETPAPNLYIETRWRDRTPFPDEQALGISAIQNRIVVRGSARSATSLGELYAVTFTIDNRVQVGVSNDWAEAAITNQFREYAHRISEDLRRELEVGIRKY